MSAHIEERTQAFSDQAEWQRRVEQITATEDRSSEQDSVAVASISPTPATLHVDDLVNLFKTAHLTSSPNARIVFAHACRPVDTDSTAVSLPHTIGGWNVFGVVQRLESVSHAFRLPFHDPSGGPRTARVIPFQLYCEIYYNPVDDACLLVNKSCVDVYLTRLDSAEDMWQEFLQFCQTWSSRRGPSALQKTQNGKNVRRPLLAIAPNAGHRKAGAAVGDAHTTSELAAPPPEQRIRADRSSLVELRDGEAATVTIKRPEKTGSGGKPSVVTQIGSPGARTNYTLDRLDGIAETSSASLYIVRHSQLRGIAVAKVINFHADKSHGLMTSAMIWEREVLFLQCLDHPNIVSLLAFDGRLGLMILPHLPSSLNRCAPSSFTPSDVHAIVRQSSSALRYLHDKKVRHNDIKPANITYSPSHGVTLIDFGLATNADEQMMTGGTPWYVPPDLITERHRDALGDVWALGVTMLFVLGRLPLPEKMTKGWLIRAVVEQSSDARGQMIAWLKIVDETRKTLDRDDLIEGLVSRMLQPERSLRIRSQQIVDAFQVPPRGLLQYT
ncbi:serine/threonine protein kinase-20 [Colletotrichum abscissum]|uniref:Serine/threonine protein kinase-20 n=1 Tax=Colletotrichum abscissum TaxID=1671311 RepID=A0A9P9X1R6_9PEZI|nr:serine/threonine protein kinase-20 [Colletotrichum abscissum]